MKICCPKMRNNFYSEPIAQMSLVNHTSFIKISGKQRWSYFLSSHSGASCDPKLYLFGRSYAALISEKRNRPRSVVVPHDVRFRIRECPSPVEFFVGALLLFLRNFSKAEFAQSHPERLPGGSELSGYRSDLLRKRRKCARHPPQWQKHKSREK